MKLFSCVCEQVVFFESVACIRCGRTLAFVPDRGAVVAMETDGTSTEPVWRIAGDDPGARGYRPCRNAREYGVCNWAVPVTEDEDYCRSCRLNRTIPDLGAPG